MHHSDWIWERKNQVPILLGSSDIVLAIAGVDWWTKPYFGQPIAAFLPELHHALRPEEGPQFRTSMQCRGHRGNGESFLAEVWVSSYKEGATPKLAAIIGASAKSRQSLWSRHSTRKKDLRSIPENTRELDVLRLVVQGLANKEIASRAEISESAVKNTPQQLSARPKYELGVNWFGLHQNATETSSRICLTRRAPATSSFQYGETFLVGTPLFATPNGERARSCL
jgi:DNA-binding CsgD family transcriptional regulator